MSIEGFKRGMLLGTPAMVVGVAVASASLLLAKYSGDLTHKALYVSLFVMLLTYLVVYAGLRTAYFDTNNEVSD